MRGEDGASAGASRANPGSPPHARGRLVDRASPLDAPRITPACAGKTGAIGPLSGSRGDHPRMRGEDHCEVCQGPTGRRITPACAGKTPPRRTRARAEADHPRMRGEDRNRRRRDTGSAGSPPHARGRLIPMPNSSELLGITPACAGKTGPCAAARSPSPDHPRMRGEDQYGALHQEHEDGSPPHARGRQFVVVGMPFGDGSPPHARGRLVARHCHAQGRRITPACAGKTAAVQRSSSTVRDHPRMRGEDRIPVAGQSVGDGSPPHARGRRQEDRRDFVAIRITPACAGKTRSSAAVGIATGDHPRMRGEDDAATRWCRSPSGSPPHARGRLQGAFPDRPRRGITPACAGKTNTAAPATKPRWDHPRMRGEDAYVRQSRFPSVGSPPHARGRRIH